MTPTIVCNESGEERLRRLLRDGLDLVSDCRSSDAEWGQKHLEWILAAREACLE
jgi:hypothetical protein